MVHLIILRNAKFLLLLWSRCWFMHVLEVFEY